jgi:hypothetical protein
MSSIPSYAQLGKQNLDTVRCYSLTELQYIAVTLVEARACDTLLDNANSKLSNRDSLISEKTFEISKLSGQIILKDKIIAVKEEELKKAQDDLITEKDKHKWTKLGWGATSVVLGSALIYFILH